MFCLPFLSCCGAGSTSFTFTFHISLTSFLLCLAPFQPRFCCCPRSTGEALEEVSPCSLPSPGQVVLPRLPVVEDADLPGPGLRPLP